MFKLLFFIFSVFIIYKFIQFVSRVLSVYSNVKKQQFGRQNMAGQSDQHNKKTGETTIHYQRQNGNKSRSSGNKKSADEEYIDFEQVKE